MSFLYGGLAVAAQYRRALLLAAVVMAGGCVTGYHRDGIIGGYSEVHLQPNVYRVSFDGSRYTSMQRTIDFALLRAAELALEKGYRHFGILDEAAYTRSGAGGADVYIDTGTVYDLPALLAVLLLVTPLLPAPTPFSSLTVLMLSEIPERADAQQAKRIYNARAVYADITGRYGLRRRYPPQ